MTCKIFIVRATSAVWKVVYKRFAVRGVVINVHTNMVVEMMIISSIFFLKNSKGPTFGAVKSG